MLPHCFSFTAMDKEHLLLEFGKRIKAIRKEKGMSQTQLAHAINKDQQSIQRLESGKINPSYIYLLEISQGLQIEIQELLSK